MAKKIIVVDDDVTVIRLAEKILIEKGFDVITADNGEEGLEKIRKEHPDLVILDVMMPEINGYDVCYELRFNEEYEKIPIIIVTSREQEILEGIGKRLNIEYVKKPFDTKALLEKVDLLINEHM